MPGPVKGTPVPALQLLIAYDLLKEGPAASAMLAWPGDSEPAAFIELAMPGERGLPAIPVLVGERSQGRN